MKKYVLGITGGIASGKSTLSKLLSSRGVKIIDADVISAGILNKGSGAYDKVREAFPQCFIGDELNRRALGNIVFNDKIQLKKLNEITHPAIINEIVKKVQCNEGIVCIDAALLFETGLNEHCDSVWCTFAPDEVRIQRIMDRNGLSYDEAKARVESQMTDEKRLSLSDLAIDTTVEWDEYASFVLDNLSKLIKENDL